ncbi:Aerotolerance-related protein [Aromatoleum petrolei]|nr:Aerotolerance-related protein [Aromatoleum petrolei]
MRSRATSRTSASAFARLALILTLIAAAPGPTHAAETGGAPAADKTLWIEAELQPDTLHVHAQARYTLRLYQAVSVRDLSFHPPESALAEIRPAGESVRELTRDGQRLRVTERRYAIFPFASGSLQLSGGHVSLRTDGGSASERRIEAPALTRNVRPVPTGLRPEEWLPARTVTLNEFWHPDMPQLRPGQPLRRRIRVEAVGVAAAQIPPLHIGADGFSIHPEPPRLEEREEDGWITGIREQTWRLVPRQGGDFRLPALQVQWWDPVAGQPRQATLLPRPIAVMASPGERAIATDEPVVAAAAAALAPVQPAPSGTTSRRTKAVGTSAALLAAIALLAVGATVMRRRATATLRRISRACRDNDPIAARANLLQWSRQIGVPGQGGLLTLAHRVGGTATGHELAALDRHLYGEQHQPWNGQQLITALCSEHHEFQPWRLRWTTGGAANVLRPPKRSWRPRPSR